MIKESDTRLNIRLPKELKAEVKKYVGSNISEEIRIAMGDLIEKKKGRENPLLFCRCCFQKQPSLEFMKVIPNLLEDEDSKFFILCDKCYEEVLTNDIEYFKEKVRGIDFNNDISLENWIAFGKSIMALMFSLCKECKENIPEPFDNYFDLIVYLNASDKPYINTLSDLLKIFPQYYSCKGSEFFFAKEVINNNSIHEKHLNFLEK